MPEVSVPSTSASVDQLASLRSEIDALLDRDVLTPRIDVAAAAPVVIGAMPTIEKHRAAVLAIFGERGSRTLDRLVPLARALSLAHAITVATTERDLEPLAKRAFEVRNGLYLAASALIERDVVSKRSLVKLTGGTSYQGCVEDTRALASWFRALPSDARAQCKVSDADLARAHTMADEFEAAFSERNFARVAGTLAMEDRARVFTLFFRAYDRARQMLSYVRWHEGDIDRIAPSLYAGRATRRSDSAVVTPPQAPTPITPTPVVSPDMPGADPFPV
ncbi:MAG: hypothetical protein J0L92_06760 [Deltaproteobacteria bacterium]|nr:hypothetical protein [Deltaproteobacteria bacterium]